ncbi:MAG: hypothetical protein ACP5ML_00900 [Fervidicoccus sp.]
MEKKYNQNERMKLEIISMIDENPSNWIKSAYFSDSEVSKIMEILYKLWEENNEKGFPIDYASNEQLKALYSKAKRYSSMKEEEAMKTVLERVEK